MQKSIKSFSLSFALFFSLNFKLRIYYSPNVASSISQLTNCKLWAVHRLQFTVWRSTVFLCRLQFTVCRFAGLLSTNLADLVKFFCETSITRLQLSIVGSTNWGAKNVECRSDLLDSAQSGVNFGITKLVILEGAPSLFDFLNFLCCSHFNVCLISASFPHLHWKSSVLFIENFKAEATPQFRDQ